MVINNGFTICFQKTLTGSIGNTAYKVTFPITFNHVACIVASKWDLSNTSSGFWGLRILDVNTAFFNCRPDAAKGFFSIVVGF